MLVHVDGTTDGEVAATYKVPYFFLIKKMADFSPFSQMRRRKPTVQFRISKLLGFLRMLVVLGW